MDIEYIKQLLIIWWTCYSLEEYDENMNILYAILVDDDPMRMFDIATILRKNNLPNDIIADAIYNEQIEELFNAIPKAIQKHFSTDEEYIRIRETLIKELEYFLSLDGYRIPHLYVQDIYGNLILS